MAHQIKAMSQQWHPSCLTCSQTEAIWKQLAIYDPDCLFVRGHPVAKCTNHHAIDLSCQKPWLLRPAPASVSLTPAIMTQWQPVPMTTEPSEPEPWLSSVTPMQGCNVSKPP
ncbi:LIM domain-containing protein unc-97 [Clarias magur]|uniref:LIM domain-containing protein unc-97 n=1 Tax=Clarias magur TaxID=1594786 RepID=A0A8J4UJG6_CLAMG|nr:LIM domain-containing protein unc-97 [Clarias magur]